MWIRERRDEGTVADMAGHSVAVMWGTYRNAVSARMEADEPFDMTSCHRSRTFGPRKLRRRCSEYVRIGIQRALRERPKCLLT